MEDYESFFSYIKDDTATGGNKFVVQSDQTSTTGRSKILFAPANSTVAIHISGTASVQVISSPFSDSSKEFTLATVATTSEIVITAARRILLNVASISGTVTAILIPNED